MTLVTFSLTCSFPNRLGQRSRTDLKDIAASLAFGSFSKKVHATQYAKHTVN